MTLVRAATPADLDQLGEMGAALAEMHHQLDAKRFMFGPGFEQGYRGWFARELGDEDALLAVAPGEGPRLAGYVYGRLEGVDWAELLDEHAALVDLYVRPGTRKAGTGEALVRHFLDWAAARGAPRVVLSTATANLTAQRLFTRLGFRPTMIEMTRESD